MHKWTINDLVSENIEIDFNNLTYSQREEAIAAFKSKKYKIKFRAVTCHECYKKGIDSPSWRNLTMMSDQEVKYKKDGGKDEDILKKFTEYRVKYPVCKMHYDMALGTDFKQKKVHRNEKCFCGSGKKLKHCCIHKKL